MHSWQSFHQVLLVGRIHKTWLMVITTSWLLLCPRLTSGLTAKVTYTAPETTQGQFPDDLNVTVTSSIDDTSIQLYLFRVKDPELDIPMYTIAYDESGVFDVKTVELDKRKNSAVYEDLIHEALIQVTIDNKNKDHLILSGEVTFRGQQYQLIPESRRKRSSASSSSSDRYLLEPHKHTAAGSRDYIVPPSEVKVSVQQTTTVDLLIPQIRTASSSLSKNLSLSSQSSAKLNRHKRQGSFYYIDVVVVIDYGIYRRFLTSSVSPTLAIYNIREYFAFIFKGVDLRYKKIESLNPKISVRLTKIIIAEEITASSFTENLRQADTPWDEVDAEKALSSFSQFAATTGSDIFAPYDHAMLFTGYDLTSAINNSPKTNSTTGLAYTSTLCRTDGKSVSVVEDLGGFQSVDTAAHELGHSLSASHDGDGNVCRSSDRYIMAGGSSPETLNNRLNPWHFSSCSINYFNNFLSRTIRSTRGQTCLNLALPISPSVPNLDGQLPGLIYSPDEQCRLIYGSSSRLCRGTEFGVAADICTSMFCFDPSTTGTCYEQTAARGTVCGNGKICLNGDCASDPRAPEAHNNCVFGDQPGLAFEERTCASFVNGFSGYCYQAVVRGRCCASCQRVHRMVTDCEYGDTVLGCQSNACSFATQDYWRKCCGSCQYGTTFVTTRAPVETTMTTKPTIATTVPTPRTTAVKDACQDDPAIRVNGRQCAEVVLDFPQFCYQPSVQQPCCQSCQSINSTVPGCEYGDLYPVSCSQLTSCVGYVINCCSTCSDGKPQVSTGGPTRKTPPTQKPSQSPSTVQATTDGGACLDNPHIRVNNLTCPTAIRETPSICYTAIVRQECCLSCRRSDSGITGCEYGDLKPAICEQPQVCNSSRAEIDCCGTCGPGGSGAESIQQGKYFVTHLSCLLLVLLFLLNSNFDINENIFS